MIIPAQTTGNGTAAQITVASSNVKLSLTGANGNPETYQLNPNIEDAGGNEQMSGTQFVLSSVTVSSPYALTLSAAANASGGDTVYTGTITGGGTNAFAGFEFTVAGFDLAANNGTFYCTASSTTTLTLTNPAGVSDTHAGTATAASGTVVYTGTITGGGTNAFAGETFVVAGFVANPFNNGTFIAVASSATSLTLDNGAATAETHAATATNQEATALTYVSLSPGVATVSVDGLITAVAEGGANVEVSYPVFSNAAGSIASAGQTGGVTNPMHGLPRGKIYKEINVSVGA